MSKAAATFYYEEPWLFRLPDVEDGTCAAVWRGGRWVETLITLPDLSLCRPFTAAQAATLMERATPGSPLVRSGV